MMIKIEREKLVTSSSQSFLIHVSNRDLRVRRLCCRFWSPLVFLEFRSDAVDVIGGDDESTSAAKERERERDHPSLRPSLLLLRLLLSFHPSFSLSSLPETGVGNREGVL